jgi:hypothetical protein
MESEKMVNIMRASIQCSRCRGKINKEESYIHKSEILCEDCYMEIRMPRRRKTHWQYLRSIKTKYLIPPK